MEPIGACSRKVVDANSLKDMVGPCGLELQTSTVSTNKVFTLWICATKSKFLDISGSSAQLHTGISSSPMQRWLEEGPCESLINGDICGLDKGRRDLIVGSSFGGTANLPECASGAKQSLVPSSSIQIWKTPGKRVMVSAYQSMRLAIVSANRP